MRLLTFSFLKKFRFRSTSYLLPRLLSNDLTEPKANVELTPDGSFIEVSPSWPACERPELRAAVLRDMRVLPEFISEREEAGLLAELEPYLKRMRYQYDHWDNAIEGYRETERDSWSAANTAVLARVLAAAFPRAAPLPRWHVLDLAAAGLVRPHVDAVRFCGDVIAGLCLASSAVMRLQHETHKHLALDVLLARRCLYIMRGVARYEFSHAVLGGGGAGGGGGGGGSWRGRALVRRRRVAVIARSPPHAAPPHPPPPLHHN